MKSKYLLAVVLTFSLIGSSQPVLANSIEWGVDVGETFEFYIDSVDTANDTDPSSVLLPLWYDWEYEDKDGVHRDYLVPRGIYQNETVTVIIEELPAQTRSDGEIYVNGDYAKGTIITPRANTTMWLSPWVSTLQYVVPTSPDISHRFPSYEFDEKGVLKEARVVKKLEDINYTYTIKAGPLPEGIFYKVGSGFINLLPISVFVIVTLTRIYLRSHHKNRKY